MKDYETKVTITITCWDNVSAKSFKKASKYIERKIEEKEVIDKLFECLDFLSDKQIDIDIINDTIYE